MWLWRVLIVQFLILSGFQFFAVLSLRQEPELRDLSNGHTLIGENIVLQCSITSGKAHYSIEWNAPLNINLTLDRIKTTTITEKDTSLGLYTIKSNYTIYEAKLQDASIYYCTVIDIENPVDARYNYIWIPVYDVDEHVTQFYPKLTVFDQANAQIQVYVRSHPKTKFYWLDKNNKTIEATSAKYETGSGDASNKYTNYNPILTFTRVSFEDFGNYTVIAENKYGNTSFMVLVNMTGQPKSTLTIDKVDKNFSFIKCQATAYPKPKIEWEFDACNSLSCFLDDPPIATNTSKWPQFRSEGVGLQTISFVSVNRSNLGHLRAISSNDLGQKVSLLQIYKGQEDFEVFSPNFLKNGSAIKVETLIGDDILIMCAVSLDTYNPEIKWYRNGRNFSLDDPRVPIKDFDEYHIQTIDAVYSTVSIVRINIDKKDHGEYYCKPTTKSGKIETKVIRVVVKELPTLNVASNMQNKTIKVKEGNSWRFYCNADGYPTPSIKWYKNNMTINTSKKFSIRENNQTLIINDITRNDNGTYKCIVTNKLHATNIKIAQLEGIKNEFDWLMVSVIILVLALVVVSIFIGVKLYKDNKLRKELQAIGLANFEEGAIESINPELGLEQQAEFLPYDKKFEIYTKNLKLGRELGSGAFGVVVKAELIDFPIEGNSTTVAVKTVNKLAGHDCIKALASELKIMVHLGTHVNIVNLIGACTKDITKKKLLVVVEFCPFGNLHDYILNHSHSFIDQRNDDSFDWKIKPKELNYVSLMTDPAADAEEANSKVPEKTYISSQDFMVWSFQIAKGMEYLATNNVLHGDLAARNVLLADNNVAKISDFGLARNMYKNDVYKKTSNEPLPVKWMALESIGENVFSTQSDVWSFGVVLWEFFSLAKTPYPGMPIDQAFYQKLCDGYRMEKPQYATTEIYNVMMDCWNDVPTDRPSFTKLAERTGKILEESIRNHYLQMNSSYVLMKSPLSNGCGVDYLTMASDPKTDTNKLYACNLKYFHAYQNTASYIADPKDSDDKV